MAFGLTLTSFRERNIGFVWVFRVRKHPADFVFHAFVFLARGFGMVLPTRSSSEAVAQAKRSTHETFQV